MLIYKLTDKHTMQREYGKSPNGNDLRGKWVLRDNEGRPIDFDTYRHDLIDRNDLRVIKMELGHNEN